MSAAAIRGCCQNKAALFLSGITIMQAHEAVKEFRGQPTVESLRKLLTSRKYEVWENSARRSETVYSFEVIGWR